ncbi:hypothetical protein [Citrobacter farmeri]|uniref:hypothetical protein n=1 Tax=Citrobacter farmeri TaxID=67824 RepID=UPI00360E81EC
MKNKTITAAQVREVFEEHGAYISDADETAQHCNENGAIMHCGLDVEGWAHRFAAAEAYQQECEAQEAAMDDVHFD